MSGRGELQFVRIQEEGLPERRVLVPASGVLHIGRAEECELRLATDRASRIHAEIRIEEGQLTLVDRGSANGTLVNEVPIARHRLTPRDRIRIGRAVLSLEAREGERQRAAASRPPRDAGAEPPAGVAEVEREAIPVLRMSPAGTAVALGVPALLIALFGVLIVQVSEGTGFFARPRSSGATGAGVASSGAGASGVDSGSADSGSGAGPRSEASQPRARAVPLPAAPGSREADASYEVGAIEDEAAAGELGWDAIARAAAVREHFAGTPGAERARRLEAVLRGIRRQVERAHTQEASATVEQLLAEGRLGEALAACRLLVRLERDDERRARWRQWTEEIEKRAANEFVDVEQDLAALLTRGRAAAALRSLLDLRQRYAGTRAFDEALPRYLDAGLAGARPREVRPRAAEVDRLLERIAVAFDSCRFRDLAPLYYRVLALDPPTDVRLIALEGLHDSFYLERMFEEFSSEIGKRPVHTAQGELTRADREEVELTRTVGGHPVPFVETWRRLSPVVKLQLFEGLVFSRVGVVGLAVFAGRIGDTEGLDRALVRLYRRAEGRELAEVLAARARGTRVPEGGYIVHRGRLVTPAEKEEDIARRRADRERERAIARELKDRKRAKKLSAYLEYALSLRKEGRFELAQRILREVAELEAGEESVEARRLLDDPLLATHVIAEHGPAANRIDLFVLGEGYPVEDDYQESFLTQARVCLNLMRNEEPYKEYDSYFNYHAVQLGSRDSGVDRIPGDVQKDTALDGKVEYEVFTVDGGKVMAILDRLGDAGRDHLAIAVGNDSASVATGGGGVASMTKGNFIPAGHEVGHAFGALHDEYDFEPGTRPGRTSPKRKGDVPTAPLPPNLMVGSDRESVLREAIWQEWIEAPPERVWNGSKVGVFEGGNRQPFEVWRPQMGCKMRDASSHFCVVCMEVMVLGIYERVRPIDRVWPEEGDVLLEAGDKRLFRVRPMQPATHELEVAWTLLDLGGSRPEAPGEETGHTAVGGDRPGEPVRRAGRFVDVDGATLQVSEIRARELDAGWYRLRATVHDPTPWVLRDPKGLLTQTRDWIIEVRK